MLAEHVTWAKREVLARNFRVIELLDLQVIALFSLTV
jgi:hypothetical protein